MAVPHETQAPLPPDHPAVIREGAVVGAIDPTENVKDLMQASIKSLQDETIGESRRQDELRLALAQRLDEARGYTRKIHKSDFKLLRALAKAEQRRVNEGIEAERRRVDERMIDLIAVVNKQSETYEKLRLSESARVDANRQEDKSAAALAAERLAAQVTLLANTQGTTAETLRNQVATTATAAAQQLQQLLAPLVEKVAALEQQSFRGQGREAVADPALTSTLAALAEGQKQSTLAAAESQKAMATSIAELARVQQSSAGKASVADPALVAALETLTITARSNSAKIEGLTAVQQNTTGRGQGQATLVAGILSVGGFAIAVIYALVKLSGH